MNWKTVTIIVFLALVGLLVLGWNTTVPVRDFETNRVAREVTEPVETNAAILRIAARAKRDYLIHPIDFKGARRLVFEKALSVAPNDLYLVFHLEANPSDFYVFYRVSREDGRLLWKVGVGTGG